MPRFSHLSRELRAAGAFLRAQALADSGRWPLWLPVALGVGIGLYFALPVEPGGLIALLTAGLTLGAGAISAREPRLGPRVALALIAALSLGFTAAKLRTEWVRAPVLTHKIGPVGFDARVVRAEPHGNGGMRVVLEPVRIRRLGPDTPVRVRVTSRLKTVLPAPGSFVHVTAVLRPPPGPSTPGDYDFARAAFYRRIGAVGYLYGRPKPLVPPRETSFGENVSTVLERLRDRMTGRIRDIIPGSDGAIAAALITGERADIDQSDEAAYRNSGLTHVLSISGLHLALAGGIFFWAIRALLALVPAISLRYPVKKWAAVAAVAGALFYLLISGCDSPAVRSFIMLAMMFASVLFDRPALSMRAVALAATIIMLLAPECVTEPGCEMSFASVIGLIALAEWVQARRAKRQGEISKAIPARLMRYGLGIVAASLIAGLASAPIAIFHFDRAAQYGLISNLAAEPVVGAVIMPAATAAMVLMPFGLDRWALIVMGWGVNAMTAIAYWTAALPGAASLTPVWPLWCLNLVAFGGLWIAINRHAWRWLGLAGIGLGVAFALSAPQPDILVARDMGAIAVRGPSGKLALVRPAKDDFAASNWLKRDGDERSAEAATASEEDGVRCDALGCIAHARDGTLIAISLRVDALNEDCTRAKIVISAVPVRDFCNGPELVIDRFDVVRQGGHAVWLGDSPRVKTVEGMRGIRPWSPRPTRWRRSNTAG